MSNDNNYMTGPDVCAELNISLMTYYRWMRDGVLVPDAGAGKNHYFHLFQKSQIARLKRERGNRLTVATWRKGMICEYRGRRVIDIMQTADGNYFFVRLESGERFRLYKNTGLVEIR